MPITITRTPWTDDDGTGTVGTVVNNAEKTTLYGQIDAALALAAAKAEANTFTALQTFNAGYKTGAVNSYINDTSNAKMTLGLTITGSSAAATVNEILALKDPAVAHGMTDEAETDTFAAFKINSTTEGGLRILGFSEGMAAFAFQGFATTGDVTKSTAATAPWGVLAAKKSGATIAALGANENIAVFSNLGLTRFILDGDGDSHQDVGTAWTNFDSHDDALVLDSLAYLVSRDDDPYKPLIRQRFGEALESMIPRPELERIKLVTFNEDGHHFVNMSKLSMLLTGAVRQVASQMRHLEARLDRALPEAS